MGKSDTAVNIWLGDKARFADLFNASVFDGEQIVMPEELEVIKGEAKMIVTDKDDKQKDVKRYRDIVMRWKGEVDFAVLACENQDKIRYAMPVRVMMYDALSYADQIAILKKEYSAKKEKLESEEFLSGMKKEDKLCPVITIVFYYGMEEWDASRNLHQMLQGSEGEELSEWMKELIPNYHINLVEAQKLWQEGQLKTDMHLVLGMLQYRNKKSGLCKYVEEYQQSFRSMDKDTCNAIIALLNADKQLKKIWEQEGEVNMCQALEELYQDGVKEGREAGIRGVIELCQEFGMTKEETVKKLEEKCSMEEETALKYLEEYWK